MKKLLSLALAAAMVTPMLAFGTVSAGAETLPAGSTSADTKIYFDAASTNWDNYQYITCYIYEYYGDALIPWGSKRGRMTATVSGRLTRRPRALPSAKTTASSSPPTGWSRPAI